MQKIACVGVGFIGSHLVKRLSDLGHKVVKVSHKDLDKFEGADVIFNLMAYGNMANQVGDDEVFEANLHKLYQLLNKKHIDFINFSTSAIQLPTQTLYTATKHAGEKLVEYYGGINIRPSSVFGEGEAPYRFIPTVIRGLKQDETIYLDPQPVHDWIYISDLIDGVISVFEHREFIGGKTINISTGQQTSNSDIMIMLQELSGKQPHIKILESQRPWDSHDWTVDNSILKLLGWKQKHSLREGLKKTYEKTKNT